MEEDFEDIILEIRRMARSGSDVPALLRRVQQMRGQIDCKLVSVICFRKAFDTGIGDVSAVAGWHGFGSELSDEQVNAFVLPILQAYRANQQLSS